MNKKNLLLGTALVLGSISMTANAVPFTPTFDDYSFSGTRYTVDAPANAFFSASYGITIDNAYLYKDSRDTFDGIGISVGETSDLGTPQTGTVTFLDQTDYVELQYWGIRATTYSAFDMFDNLIDTFSIGANTLGTYTFNASSDFISYVTWNSDGGFGQISGLSYDYDGTTDGINTDITTSVPEPSMLALVGAGLFGLAYTRRRKAV